MPGEPIESGGLLLGLRDLADDMKERSISLVENRRQRSIANVQFKDVVRAVRNRVRGRKFSISTGSHDRRPSTMDYQEIPIDNLAEGSNFRSNNGMIV
jgi:hypothetical protein